MNSTSQLLAEFVLSSQNLISALNDFSSEQWNIKPAENSWSAAQVAHHLLVIESGVNKFFIGKTKPSPRSGDGIIKRLDQFLENRTRTYSAPDYTLPPDDPGSQQELIQKLEASRKKLSEHIIKLDLNVLCLDFKHFFFGELTRIEWVHFVMYHSNRHLIQLQNIKNAL
jgi:hypothetical protein